MDRVLPEPVSPPVELLLLLRRCPRRGERGRRGERPGLPDIDPFPFDPTTSSFETERELPYMLELFAVELRESRSKDSNQTHAWKRKSGQEQAKKRGICFLKNSGNKLQRLENKLLSSSTSDLLLDLKHPREVWT